MRPFLPPSNDWLFSRIARRNDRRARLLLARLAPRTPWEARALGALAAALRPGRPGGATALLLDPAFRAWLNGAEEAVALSNPPREAIPLLELGASGSHLAAIAAEGRLDGRSRRRARGIGERLTRERLRELPSCILLHLPRGFRGGPLPIDAPGEPELGLAAGEALLWGPTGPVALAVPRSGARARAVDGSLRLEPAGQVRLLPPRAPGGWPILLGRRVHSGRAGLRTGGHHPAAARRLEEALALLERAWPAGHAEVRAHTCAIIPLSEKGTVSFSLPSRPGASFINLQGKSVIDLADDLLHETAHHRLHALEEIHPLVRAGADPFFHSPWRRGRRPLRGILHATYTFAWRAQLLTKLASLPGPMPRRWLRAEAEHEFEALEATLRDLRAAARQGLLTPQGVRLGAAVGRRLSRMAGMRPSRERREKPLPGRS